MTLGNTQVLAAVSLQVGTPAAGFPNFGDFTLTTPMYSTYIKRVLHDSKLVNMEALVIIPAKAAWRLQVVCLVLNNDGNIRDGMLLASMAALRDTRLPTTSIDKDGVVCIVEASDKTNMTRLCDTTTSNNIPIPLTVGFVKTCNNEIILLVDPDSLEQEQCDSTCCMVVNGDGQVVNVELSGSLSISSKQLALVAQMAMGRAREIQGLLE